MIIITTTAKTVTIETPTFKWNIVKSRIKGQIPYASGTRLLTEMGEVTLPFGEVQGNGDAFGTAEDLQAWIESNCFSTGGGTGEGVQSIVEGPGITVDSSDPGNPIVSSNFSNPTWSEVDEKPEFMAVGDTDAQARAAIGLGSASTRPAGDFATSTQGAKADTAVQPSDLVGQIYTTYYISSSGSDTNDGLTPETPWLTLAKTQDIAIDEQARVLLRSGDTFQGSIGFVGKTTGVIVSTYGGEVPATINVIDSASHGVNIYNCSNVEITNIKVVGLGASTWGNSSGIFIYNDTHILGVNYRIHRCEVTQFGAYGLVVGMDAEPGTIKIKGLEISDCKIHGNMNGIFTYGNKDSEYSIEDAVIKGNETYDNLGSGSVTWGQSGSGIMICGFLGGTINKNKSWNNGHNSNYAGGGPYGIWLYNCKGTVISHCESFDNGAAGTADGGGFDIDGGCQDCVIEYCYSHNNYGPAILFYQFENAPNVWDNNVFRFNTSYNDGRGGHSGGIMYGMTIDKGLIHDNKFHYNSDGLASSMGLIHSWLDDTTVNIELARNTILIGSDIPALPSSTAKLTLKNNLVIETSNTDWIVQTTA